MTEASSFPERAAATAGGILLAVTLGFTLYQAAYSDQSPPDIAVEALSVVRVRQGFLVTFRAVNHGGLAAEGVDVEGRLAGASAPGASSQTTLDYLPGHSERSGGLFFSVDPACCTLELRALGYEIP